MGQLLRTFFRRIRLLRADMVSKAVADGRWNLLYVMVPADDGGQTYEMRCKICGESGNILASRFIHAQGCPVDIQEKELFQRSQETQS